MPFPHTKEPIPIVNNYEDKSIVTRPDSRLDDLVPKDIPQTVIGIRTLRSPGINISGDMNKDRIIVDLKIPISIGTRIGLQAKIGSKLDYLFHNDKSLKTVGLSLGIDTNKAKPHSLEFGTDKIGIAFDRSQYFKLLTELNILLHGKTLPAKGTNK
jgi:hypothetical protein